MQYNTPQQERRPTRMDPPAHRAEAAQGLQTKKSQLQKVLPLLLLFSALLIVISSHQPPKRLAGGSGEAL